MRYLLVLRLATTTAYWSGWRWTPEILQAHWFTYEEAETAAMRMLEHKNIAPEIVEVPQ